MAVVSFVFGREMSATIVDLPGVPDVGEVVSFASLGKVESTPDTRWRVVRRAWEVRRSPMPGGRTTGIVFVHLRKLSKPAGGAP